MRRINQRVIYFFAILMLVLFAEGCTFTENKETGNSGDALLTTVTKIPTAVPIEIPEVSPTAEPTEVPTATTTPFFTLIFRQNFRQQKMLIRICSKSF